MPCPRPASLPRTQSELQSQARKTFRTPRPSLHRITCPCPIRRPLRLPVPCRSRLPARRYLSLLRTTALQRRVHRSGRASPLHLIDLAHSERWKERGRGKGFSKAFNRWKRTTPLWEVHLFSHQQTRTHRERKFVSFLNCSSPDRNRKLRRSTQHQDNSASRFSYPTTPKIRLSFIFPPHPLFCS